MKKEKSVSGHGVFIYDAKQTIDRYGSAEMVAKAIKECDMQHAWIRIHGATQSHAENPTLPLINALRNRGIAVAGWGWCQGAEIEMEAELAITSLREFQLEHYIADIEDGVGGARWKVAEVRDFLKSVREALPDAQIGVSSFGFIPWHKPELMQAAENFVDFFAPQVYWFRHPSKKIVESVGESLSDFPLNSSTAYARLCLKKWREVVSKPIVLTGQAYWGESADFNQGNAESKLNSFLENFADWKNLQGINWWHLGGRGQEAMSFAMFQAIKDARLNQKFVTSPATHTTVSSTAAPAKKTVKNYAEKSAADGSCSTEGVKELSRQIFAVLQESVGTDELVGCDDIVEIAGPSTIPFLQPAAKKALAKAVDEKGEKPKLLHAYRTVAQQYVLYYWFKHGKCSITLAAQPGNSPHEQAIAIDIKENARWRKVLAKHNWRWRGPSDPGHFTYVGNGISSKIRTESIRAFQKLWNRRNPHDLIEEDGIYGDVETGPRLLKSPVDGW